MSRTKIFIFIIIFIYWIILFHEQLIAYNKNEPDLSKVYIELNGKKYSGDLIYKLFDKKISKINFGDNKKILKYYGLLLIKVENVLKIDRLDSSERKKIFDIHKVIKQLEYKYKDIIFNTVRKVKLGKSESGKIIYGYYKGNPNNGFFGIFANLHGSYEYGTYETANFLIKELKKSKKTGWFIIPTLNPDGLSYYEKKGKQHTFYMEGRDNINNIDLNRNFCTNNFILKTFNKYGSYFKTGNGGCNSEKETKTIINTLEEYKFNKIISLHSVGGNFFIPDNSINDKNIIDLGKKMKKVLRNYDFDILYTNTHEKKHKIFEYEIDEGGSKKFTGTMETYIYEKYNIPILIIELKDHGKIEYDLLKITSLLNDN